MPFTTLELVVFVGFWCNSLVALDTAWESRRAIANDAPFLYTVVRVFVD